MALSEKQISEVKKQIFEQTKHLPEDRRKQIEEQINKMSSEELEAFVQQQMESKKSPQDQKGVFRSIIDGDIPSKKIDENKEAVAVLDIKPISPGHVIIIPKKSVSDIKLLPSSCFNLAKKVTKKISSKLKAQGSEIQTEFKFGEVILNVMPIYDKSLNINSPRHDASEEEINEAYNKLKVIKKPKIIKLNKKPKSSNLIKLKRRIP